MKQNSFRRLTREDRCQIAAYVKIGKSFSSIARCLGFHKSTISREINANLIWQHKYDYTKAHADSLKRRTHCHRKPIIVGPLLDLIKSKLEDRWSPEQISGRLKLEKTYSVSTQTIYTFIYTKAENLKACLRGKRNRGWGRFSQRKRRENDDRLKIENRPKSANSRIQPGHWERDLFLAAHRKTVLACVERKTRFLKLKIVDSLTSKNITHLTTELIAASKLPLLSVTNDNGSEFADSKNMHVPVYFCKPFRPQQRGTIENAIGLLRTYISRKTDLSSLTTQDIQKIEDSYNHRPKKLFNFKTPFEMAQQLSLQ